MERDLHEILASQRKMLQRLGKRTKDDTYPTSPMLEYERQLAKVKQWASRSANVEICYLQHRDVVAEPFRQALQINEFLDWQLMPEPMAQVVDAGLHRGKA